MPPRHLVDGFIGYKKNLFDVLIASRAHTPALGYEATHTHEMYPSILLMGVCR
jgi:hypothetical protein